MAGVFAKRLALALLSIVLLEFASSTAVYAQRQRTQVIVRPIYPLYPVITPEEAQRYRDEKVVTRVGIRLNKQGDAVHFAALYTPYARMSALAYTNKPQLDEKDCPDLAKFGAAAGSDREAAQRASWMRRLAHEKWQCIGGHVGPLPCPSGKPHCNAIGGLQLHVWVNKSRRCAPVVVFRGTDITDIGDWISNFRWFNKLLPIADQYDQVAWNIGKIVNAACPGGKATVLTAGHSLGGGLAQYAAFTDKRVRYAYTFDPSPVTGFDVPRHDPHKKRMLGIDRVHEVGEVLATPRYLIGGFIPARNCKPYTRYVRFNTIFTGLGFSQHSIGDLTDQLEKRAVLGNAAKTIGSETEKNCEVDADWARN